MEIDALTPGTAVVLSLDGEPWAATFLHMEGTGESRIAWFGDVNDPGYDMGIFRHSGGWVFHNAGWFSENAPAGLPVTLLRKAIQ